MNVIVLGEGYSELHFSQKVLFPYIYDQSNKQLLVLAHCVLTSKDMQRGRTFRGGINSYQQVKNDINHCLSSRQPVTTMIDYFHLPTDFPGYKEAISTQNPCRAVQILETAFKNDILLDWPDLNPQYFMPYFQLHEFEALLYCNLEVLKCQYLDQMDQSKIDELIDETSGLAPEEINHGETTAPSKRLLQKLNYRKGDNAADLVGKIGIPKLISLCPHFSEWITRILNLSENGA